MDIPNDLTQASAVQLLAGYAAGDVTPTEVTDAVLEKIAVRQPALNCFYLLDEAGARAAAAASTRRWAQRRTQRSLQQAPVGALDGVPFTVKENVAVAGMPRPSGTAALADAAPETSDGPATARSREAGGVLLGTTVMPDFGMLSSGVSSLHGITRSPWNPAWTVGGSSGGAGAAATAGLGALHVGSDIGGSLRLPASWLGLATLKPSFGRVPVDPPYLGRVAGPMARTVADVALYLSVLAGGDVRDYSSLPITDVDVSDLGGAGDGAAVAGLRVGVHVDAGAGTATDPEVAALVRRAARTFEEGGASVEELPPFMSPQLLHDLDLFLRVRSWADLSALPVDRRLAVLPFIQEWCHGGADVSGVTVMRCYGAIQEIRRVAVAATTGYDLVLSPVTPVAAFPAEWPMPSNDPATALHHCGFAAPYNVSEQPAASVNCGFTADGRPVGLQLAGRRFADVEVLRAAAWYEAARPGDAAPVWPG